MVDYAEKRREPRIPFRSDCVLEVIAPPEHAKMGSMRGQTVNITEHGVMIIAPDLREEVVGRWQEEIQNDRIILVRIRLTAYPGSPPLKGQIVWLNWGKHEEYGPVCQLGLLFQILSDFELEALQDILAGVATQQEL